MVYYSHIILAFHKTHKIEVITTTGKTIITAEIHGVSQKEAIQKAQKVLRKQGQALATSTQDYTPGKSTGGRYTNEQLKKQGWIITQHQPDDDGTLQQVKLTSGISYEN